MKKSHISKLFNHEGLILENDNALKSNEINIEEIKSALKKYGIIVFRGFDFEPKIFKIARFSSNFSFIWKCSLAKKLSLLFRLRYKKLKKPPQLYLQGDYKKKVHQENRYEMRIFQYFPTKIHTNRVDRRKSANSINFREIH